MGHFGFGKEPGNKFQDHTAQMHELMEKLGVRHVYNNELHVPHLWSGGWVKPVIDALAEISEAKVEKPPQ
jgi:hypothetical protein